MAHGRPFSTELPNAQQWRYRAHLFFCSIFLFSIWWVNLFLKKEKKRDKIRVTQLSTFKRNVQIFFVLWFLHYKENKQTNSSPTTRRLPVLTILATLRKNRNPGAAIRRCFLFNSTQRERKKERKKESEMYTQTRKVVELAGLCRRGNYKQRRGFLLFFFFVFFFRAFPFCVKTKEAK